MDGVANFSSGGKMVLINSVLYSIPIYTFAAYATPKKIVRDLEGSFSTFLWGKYQVKPKKRWKSWKAMARLKEEGGL